MCSPSAMPSSTSSPTPRRISWCARSWSRDPCSSSTRRAPSTSTPPWARPRWCRAARPPTPSRASLRFGGHGRLHRQGQGRRSRRRLRPRPEIAGHRLRCAAGRARPGTGRCFILVTPDGERTMNTFLGAGQGLTAADVDEAAVKAAAVVYLEGYLWDPPGAKEAFIAAAKIAHAAGTKVALTLSDSILRRPLSRRVPGADPCRAHRHPVRQRARADIALHDGRFRHGACGAARRGRAGRRHALGEGRPRGHPRGDRGGTGPSHRAASSTPPGRAISSRRAFSSA